MRRTQCGWWWCAAAAMMAAALVTATPGLEAHGPKTTAPGAQERPSGDSATQTISVDMSITHRVIDADGNDLYPALPPTTFTVTRMRTPDGWKTMMSYQKHRGPATRASAHPLDGARIEFDESSNATRVYNADGTINPMLSSAGDRPLPGAAAARQWLDGLIASPADRAARVRELQAQYGAPIGRVRGLDRFLAQQDDVVQEVLADAGAALPVEINTVRNGIFESQTVVEYEKRTDGTFVRRRIRSERAAAAGDGHRSQLIVELTNLRVDGRASW